MSSRDAAIPIAEAVWGYGAGHVLDAVTSQGHLHFADDCRKGSKRIKDTRQAKNVSDRRAGELAEELADAKLALQAAGQALTDTADERDLLASIVRDLAATEAPLDAEYGHCMLCEKPSGQHAFACPHERARAWLASQEPQT